MHVSVIAVGKRQPEWIREACRQYSSRFPGSWSFRLIELDPGKSARATREAQAGRVLAGIRAPDLLIALDEQGAQLSSIEFSQKFESWTQAGRDLVFVVGGADGLGKSVLDRAEYVLSLGAMTLAHGLARIVLLEQLYRAHTLATGHPYHRS